MVSTTLNSSVALSTAEISLLVEQYIGIDGGLLGKFNKRSYAKFYSEHCNLSINPDEYEGTIYERFIYDPQGFIENPRALKKDLEKTKREIQVKVIIYRP